MTLEIYPFTSFLFVEPTLIRKLISFAKIAKQVNFLRLLVLMEIVIIRLPTPAGLALICPLPRVIYGFMVINGGHRGLSLRKLTL